MLTPDALYEVAARLNQKSYDLIYSDEDLLSTTGKFIYPLFKPDWSPEILYHTNYICHFSVVKTELMTKIGGFDPKANGAQDWDVLLKIMELTNNIGHISKVLYHWRISKTSTASGIGAKPYAMRAIEYAIQNHFIRANIPTKVSYNVNDGVTIIWPNFIEKKCQLIILCDDLENAKNHYEKYNSNDMTVSFVKKHSSAFVKQLNHYYEKNSVDYYIFINDKIKIISDDWLINFKGMFSLNGLGAIGAKIINQSGQIVDFGKIINANIGHRLYFGAYKSARGQFGSALHYRNLVCITDQCFAITRSTFEKVGLFNLDDQIDDVFNNYFLQIFNAGLRLVTNPTIIGQIKKPLSHTNARQQMQCSADFTDPYAHPQIFTEPKLFINTLTNL